MNKQDNRFFNHWSDISSYSDAVFAANSLAKKAAEAGHDVINATLGTLYDESGKLFVNETVYRCLDEISPADKARYASDIAGNTEFCTAVWNWINRLDNIHLPHRIVASAGGTGAIILPLANTLEPGSSLLIPSIGWSSYRSMARQMNLVPVSYPLLKLGEPSVDGILQQAEKIMDSEGKVTVIINDPCQNPTGISYGKPAWVRMIREFNRLAEKGPVIIINDVAYLDYSLDWENATDYMEAFNDISENVVINIAFSCSKTMTAYGQRAGANIIIARSQHTADSFHNQYKRTARCYWSNINNAFMKCFADVIDSHQEEFLRRKQEGINMLASRSRLFIKQAKECGLPLYPYTEGFFITVSVPDQEILDRYYQLLADNHIYTVKLNGGIRIAICGLSAASCDELAPRMEKLLDEAAMEKRS